MSIRIRVFASLVPAIITVVGFLLLFSMLASGREERATVGLILLSIGLALQTVSLIFRGRW